MCVCVCVCVCWKLTSKTNIDLFHQKVITRHHKLHKSIIFLCFTSKIISAVRFLNCTRSSCRFKSPLTSQSLLLSYANEEMRLKKWISRKAVNSKSTVPLVIKTEPPSSGKFFTRPLDGGGVGGSGGVSVSSGVVGVVVLVVGSEPVTQ